MKVLIAILFSFSLMIGCSSAESETEKVIPETTEQTMEDEKISTEIMEKSVELNEEIDALLDSLN